jgi:hypothetical protein
LFKPVRNEVKVADPIKAVPQEDAAVIDAKIPSLTQENVSQENHNVSQDVKPVKHPGGRPRKGVQ